VLLPLMRRLSREHHESGAERVAQVTLQSEGAH
jgi:hypothetical protein